MWGKRHKRVLSATGMKGARLNSSVVNAMPWAQWPTLPDHSPLHRVPGKASRVIQMSFVSLLKVKKWSHSIVSDSATPLTTASIHGIFQARILEWVAISFSRGYSWPRDWTQVSCTAGRLFTIWATREALQICYSFQIWILGLTLT